MNELTEEKQQLAVFKVLEEMKKVEEIFKSQNASWMEQLLDAHCLSLHQGIGERDVRDMEEKYGFRYKLANAFYSEKSIGIPLVKETLVGNNTLTGETDIPFQCEFGRVDWYETSRKSKRYFSFRNDGEIIISKRSKNGITSKNPTEISYDAAFDVLSNDFNINITTSKLANNYYQKKIDSDCFSISIVGNILTKKMNDIEIIEDLTTGTKLIRIIKEYDKKKHDNNTAISFEAILTKEDALEMGYIEIQTHKGNGKVNGTYRFDVSKEKGVRAHFYSRKGIKVDLTNNPILLEMANQLLLPVANSKNDNDVIISDFAHSTQNTIAKNLNQHVIRLDSSDFNMEAIMNADKKIMETLKSIKGEITLAGLVERINHCINWNHQIEIQKEEKQKTLKLKSSYSSLFH